MLRHTPPTVPAIPIRTSTSKIPTTCGLHGKPDEPETSLIEVAHTMMNKEPVSQRDCVQGHAKEPRGSREWATFELVMSGCVFLLFESETSPGAPGGFKIVA